MTTWDSQSFLNFVKSRQSIRKFKKNMIKEEIIREILECGRWAPSGMGNEPWKVMVVMNPGIKKLLAKATHYSNVIESAAAALVVFFDVEKGYHQIKDMQSMGAFMENLLLGAHAFKLGAVWVGEILNQKEKVNELLNCDPSKFELMGVIAIGEIDEEPKALNQRGRRELKDFVEWF